MMVPSGDREAVRPLADALWLRQRSSPTRERAALLTEIDRALEDDAVPLPPALEVIESSSLGSVDARALRASTPSETIAVVLARIDAGSSGDDQPEADGETRSIAAGLAVRIEGPVADWLRELDRLRRESGVGEDKLLDELGDLGFLLDRRALDGVLDELPVCSDRALIRSVVTILGGDWTGRGYEACYDAALDGTPPTLRVTVPVRTGISGLNGADPLTLRTMQCQAQPTYDRLPVAVRGRDAERLALLGSLSDTAAPVQILVGDSGAGKTTLARQVAKDAHERRYRVWWVPAADRNQVTRGLLAVATDLGAPVTELNALQSAQVSGAEMLWRRLDASGRRWLLVFDDVGDPSVLDVPDDAEGRSWARRSPAGLVIVTSRRISRTDWDAGAAVTRVRDLTEEAGALVVLDQLGGEPAVVATAAARHLARRLGGVALALRTVGTYLRSSGMRIEDVIGRVGPIDLETSSRIRATWRLLISVLDERGVPEARTLIRLLGHYAPNWVVPVNVLRTGRLAACFLTDPGPSDAIPWQRALDNLVEVGLVEYRETAGQRVRGMVLHPLIAEVSRIAGPGEDPASPHDDAVQAGAVRLLLEACARLDAGRPADWPAVRRLEPHVYALLNAIVEPAPTTRSLVLQLADRVAEGLIRAGLFRLGEELIRHARERTGAHDPNATDWLAAEHTLAWALGLRGELVHAEQRLRDLLANRRRIHGSEHPATLAVRDLLAWVLAEQGRLAEAAREFDEMLPLAERVLGEDHPHTLSVRHRIAWITGLRGRPDLAQQQFEALLPRRRRVHGEAHMEVLSTRYRLAWARAMQGDYDRAEQDFRDLLVDVVRVSGDEESAAVALVRGRLGCIWAWQGHFDAAETELRQVVSLRSRVLGAHHPRTLRARIDLATAYQRRGDLRQAERLYREIVEVEERAPEMTKDHPLALQARGYLAGLLAETGRLDEAERTVRALIVRSTRVSGPDHPATMLSRYTLALTIAHRGRLREAEDRMRVVVTDQQSLCGVDHRYSLQSRAALAEIVGRRGRLAESEEAHLLVLGARRRLLGEDHPQTLQSREQIVWVVGESRRLAEAIEACDLLVADCSRILGPEHPATLSARYRLAWSYGLADRGEEAEPLYRRLVRDQHRALGRDHPHTLRSRHGLARELMRTGCLEQAADELRGVLLDRTEILGTRHPDTMNNRHSLAVALALQGLLPEAEQSIRATLRQQTEILGPGHPHTLSTRERLLWIECRRERLVDPPSSWRALLRDRERLLGPAHPDTVRSRERVGHHDFEVPQLW